MVLLAGVDEVLDHHIWLLLKDGEVHAQAHAAILACEAPVASRLGRLQAALADGGQLHLTALRRQGAEDALQLPRGATLRAHLHHEALAAGRQRGARGLAGAVFPAALAQRAHVRAAEAQQIEHDGEIGQPEPHC